MKKIELWNGCGEMTGEPPHTRSFRDKMQRYRGNIDNELYKAEQACQLTKEYQMLPGRCDCPFVPDTEPHVCPLQKIRAILGDHVEHHDIPQCDTGDVVK